MLLLKGHTDLITHAIVFFASLPFNYIGELSVAAHVDFLRSFFVGVGGCSIPFRQAGKGQAEWDFSSFSRTLLSRWEN